MVYGTGTKRTHTCSKHQNNQKSKNIQNSIYFDYTAFLLQRYAMVLLLLLFAFYIVLRAFYKHVCIVFESTTTELH